MYVKFRSYALMSEKLDLLFFCVRKFYLYHAFLHIFFAIFSFQKRAKAQHLLDKVFDHLELIEKDYFGLQFLDLSPDPDTMVRICSIAVLQIRRGNRDDLGIISHISP